MNDRIEAFLQDLDDALKAQADGRRLDLYHIGRSAIVWEYGSVATTQDIDVLIPEGDSDLVGLALKLVGKDTSKAMQHGLYLEIVADALPPTPAGYQKRAKEVQGPWNVLRVYHLEPHDLAATKLRRFSAKDREDIRFLCDQELLDAEKLERMLEKAFLWSTPKDGDELRDTAFEHLRVVQRYLRGEIAEF
jgi:hypothetical protein